MFCAYTQISFDLVGEVAHHWSLREKHVLLHVVHIAILMESREN